MESKKILAVDDEIEILKFIKKALTKNGYDVTATTNPFEALNILKIEIFDLIILDLRMPNIKEFELLEIIKGNYPQAEVIIITAHATIETAIKCMKLGADDYLIKPFEINELLATVEKALEIKQLKSQLVSLKEMDKLKDEFISTISHELKTPIQAISGAVELLLNYERYEIERRKFPRRQLDKDIQKLIEIIDRQSAKMKSLVEDLLDFVRMEAGFMELKKENTSINKIINDSVKEIQSLADGKKIEITQEIASDMDAIINCDSKNIKRVITNLLTNSLKYTPVGGSVSVWFNGTNGELEIGVEDTGIGISKENLEKVFERFYRVDQSLTRQQGGFGLGLSICKKIVELHGGKIWVESDGLGKGSKFMVILPIK